jgi:hypothetical protein
MGRKSFITGVSGDFLRDTSTMIQNVRTLTGMSRLCIVLRVIAASASVLFLATGVGNVVKKKGNLNYPSRHLCKWSSVNGQNPSSQSRNRPM